MTLVRNRRALASHLAFGPPDIPAQPAARASRVKAVVRLPYPALAGLRRGEGAATAVVPYRANGGEPTS